MMSAVSSRWKEGECGKGRAGGREEGRGFMAASREREVKREGGRGRLCNGVEGENE